MMNCGEMREKITIQKKHSVTDDYTGGEIETFEDIMTLRAKKKTVSTKEFLQGNRDSRKRVYKFICRKRDIDSDMYVFFNNERYNILHVHEFEDNLYLELTCEVID